MLNRVVKAQNKSSLTEIQRSMDTARNEYLKELAKLRRKYSAKFTALAAEYDACLLQER